MDKSGGSGKKWSYWVVCGGSSGYCGLEWAGGGVLPIVLIKQDGQVKICLVPRRLFFLIHRNGRTLRTYA